jgi:hypothetical protein
MPRNLDTQSTYSPDGTELWSVLGPLHLVQLPDGSATQERAHTTTTYDEDLPGGKDPMHLPSTVTSGAQAVPTPSDPNPVDVDKRVTHYSYTGSYGLTLRQPTSVTVGPGGGTDHLNLTSTTQYEADGRVKETRTPSGNSDGSDAHTTRTLYWNAPNTPADCTGHYEWTNSIAFQAATSYS